MVVRPDADRVAARLRPAPPPPHGDDRRRGPRIPARPRPGRAAPRRRRAGARGRPHRRGQRRARAAGRDHRARRPPTCCASPGISATAICLPSFSATASASAATTSSRRWSTGLGATVTPIVAAFDPEGGAYAHDTIITARTRMTTTTPASTTTTGSTMRRRMAEVRPLPTIPADDIAPRRHAVAGGRPAQAAGVAVAGLSGRRAISYSHGLEWAIEDGTVTRPGEPRSLARRHPAPRRRTQRRDPLPPRLAGRGRRRRRPASQRSPNSAPPSSRRRSAIWRRPRRAAPSCRPSPPHGRTPRLARRSPPRSPATPVPYPVAVAVAAAAHDVPLRAGARAPCSHGFVANVVSAGVRAIPIGQSDGQRVIAALGARRSTRSPTARKTATPRRSRRRGAPRRHRLA